MTINERVKKIRQYEDLTLEKFGARLGVSRAAVGNIENGNRGVTDQMVKSICREFHVNEKWLRDGVGSIYIMPDNPDAAIIEDILFDVDNPVYKVALDVLRVYKKLEPDYKALLEEFAKQLCEEMKKDREN